MGLPGAWLIRPLVYRKYDLPIKRKRYLERRKYTWLAFERDRNGLIGLAAVLTYAVLRDLKGIWDYAHGYNLKENL